MAHPLVERYEEAATPEDAYDALLAVADDGVAREQVGDLAEQFWVVATELVEGGRLLEAVEAQRRAATLAPDDGAIRAWLGWYLLLSGEEREADAAFAAARATEDARDGSVDLVVAQALDDAGRTDDALATMDRALAIATDSDAEILREVLLERAGLRARAGLEPDDHDRAAATLVPVPGRPSHAVVPWFPADQHAAVSELWPETAESLADPTAHHERVEEDARMLAEHTGRRPALVPVDLEAFLAWAEAHGFGAATRTSLEAYAGERHAAGESVAWPPGRNDPCWCGSDRKYKRCCGR